MAAGSLTSIPGIASNTWQRRGNGFSLCRQAHKGKNWLFTKTPRPCRSALDCPNKNVTTHKPLPYIKVGVISRLGRERRVHQSAQAGLIKMPGDNGRQCQVDNARGKVVQRELDWRNHHHRRAAKPPDDI